MRTTPTRRGKNCGNSCEAFTYGIQNWRCNRRAFNRQDPNSFAALLGGVKKDGRKALLEYFFVPSGVALFVVQLAPGQPEPKVSAFLLPDDGNTLAAEIRRFREQLASRDLDYQVAARHLYNRLLAPASRELKSTTEWTVSPDGALWDVPFGALIGPDGHLVVETRTIGITPSLTASAQLLSRPRPAPSDAIALLAFGNPLPSPVPAAGCSQ